MIAPLILITETFTSISLTAAMDDVTILQPAGILDSTQASTFRQNVSDCVRDGAKHILIDFQDVTFMDSSGLGALVLALKTARSSKVKMSICAINDQVKMLFELTSMDRVFELHESREAFEATLGK